jgi:hypothetical protein
LERLCGDFTKSRARAREGGNVMAKSYPFAVFPIERLPVLLKRYRGLK